jgi:hypothetical protein
MTVVTGERLEELWATMSARASTSTFRTVALDVVTPQGPVLVAVDLNQAKHLLVPLAARQTFRQEVDGQAVVLRKRPLEGEDTYRDYASLELVDTDMSDLFTALCVEVVEEISTSPDRAVAALRKVLQDWRALLAAPRETLTSSALVGLFGELTVLKQMTERDPGAVMFWVGPSGAPQDFRRELRALEMKTTASPVGRTVQIHGVDQLDMLASGRLLLHWSRVRTDRGVTVPDLVDDILGRTDDVQAFTRLLQEAGYRAADRELYARRRFEVMESRTYLVGPGFPRIVAASLTGDAVLAGVGAVDYTIDLDSATAEAARIDGDPVDEFLELG